MMNINITHIARLANIKLTNEEARTFEKQLARILAFFDRLEKVPTAKTYRENSQPFGKPPRRDISEPSLDQEDALANVVTQSKGYVVVPGIFEEA